MSISFEEILQHVLSNETHYNKILDLIEAILRTAQDIKKVPIYSTKRRVKTVNSVYLKTKRDKAESLSGINDFAGFRILALFEQDLLDIHRGIIEDLCKAGFELKEFRFFNWKENDELIISMKDIISNICPGGINIVPRPKDYKSIHYLFTYNSYFVEIQLRTLLQDVWAELEHALSYKQINVHPHIKKSFTLLGRDLQTNDDLVAHLRSISDREKVGHLYSMEKGGPTSFYGYEEKVTPDEFKSGPLKKYFDDYINLFTKGPRVNLRKDKSKCGDARALLGELCKQIKDNIEKPDDKVRYFLNMEEAFLNYWEAGEEKLNKALTIYETIKKPFEGYYMLHFRLGEIYFIKGRIEKALVSFDRCEELIQEGDIRNRYRVKNKLAYIYWLLGPEYIDFTIEKIDDAEKIFNEMVKDYPDYPIRNLRNNICAYYFDDYLIALNNFLRTGKDQDIVEAKYKVALEKLKLLEDTVDLKTATTNILDTLSWCYYNIYLRDKKNNRGKLEEAKKICQLIGDEDREDNSTFKITSLNIQKTHIQEIMNEK
jgi:putative GTP pyrophosphokinase